MEFMTALMYGLHAHAGVFGVQPASTYSDNETTKEEKER